MTGRTRLKVCCIESVEEARLAVSLGADAVGLVSAMPSGPGVISEDAIARIAPTVPPPVATFLLTSEVDAETIVRQQQRTGCSVLQLCDLCDAPAWEELRQRLPGVRRAQVVHVTGPESVDEALDAARCVDALLLDSGNRGLAVKQLGGTGRTHDWSLSRTICERSPVPVFLAGGLRPDNVVEAVRAVRPFGVDVCSGVRTNGRLDAAKLAAFVQALASA